MPTPEPRHGRTRPAGSTPTKRGHQPAETRVNAALIRSTVARQGRLSELLERVARASVAITTKALLDGATAQELTLQQWRALLLVGDRTEGMTVSEVGTRVGVTLPATSRLLRRLALRGYMTVTQDEADHRATRVGLTDEGRELRDLILRHRRQRLETIVAQLRPTNATLAEFALVAEVLERSQ